MGSPVPLRDDFDAAALRLLARRTRDADQGRRLLALAAIYDGGSRGDAARIGSVGLQTVLDWVLRFNAAGPDYLIGGKAPGQTPKLNEAQREALGVAKHPVNRGDRGPGLPQRTGRRRRHRRAGPCLEDRIRPAVLRKGGRGRPRRHLQMAQRTVRGIGKTNRVGLRAPTRSIPWCRPRTAHRG